MKTLTRALLFASIAAGVAMFAAPLHAQSSQRGQPSTPFGLSDFAKLRWIEGSWSGTSPGEPNVYEQYRFLNDSTVEIAYYADSSFGRQTGSGRVYVTVGRIYHTFGPARWGASNVDANGIYFIPQVNARNTFAWTTQSPDAWTATARSGASGRERVTIYTMQRVRRP